MEKIDETHFNIISNIMKYLPLKKSLVLANEINNKLLSKILFDNYFQQPTAYISAPKNDTLEITSIPFNRSYNEGIIPKINFDNHFKKGIRNYCFCFDDKTLNCIQFEPFKYAEFTYGVEIETLEFVPLGSWSFYAIVNKSTMYKYMDLEQISIHPLHLTVEFLPVVIDEHLYNDLYSDHLLVINLKTLMTYELSLKQSAYITIISSQYVIINCSKQGETLPDSSILPETTGSNDDEIRYKKRNALFKMKLSSSDKFGRITIQFVKYLPHTLLFDTLDYENGYYWAHETEKLDENTELHEYAYFYHNEHEINKYQIPNREKVMVCEKYDAERALIQYEHIFLLFSIRTGNLVKIIDLAKDYADVLGRITKSLLFFSIGEHYHHLSVMIEKEDGEKRKKYILDKDFKVIQEIKEHWYQIYYC